MSLGEKFTNFLKRLNSITMRVPLSAQAIFARHLAVMAKAGLPLLESLKLLKRESPSRAMGVILDQVIDDVSNGQFLSASLDRFRSIFGNLFINIIRVGESTGILPENLNYLADELKKKQALKRKVIGALMYPAVIVCATFGITGLLTVFIFPKILPVFESMKVDLPLSTRILIGVSNLLTNYGLLVFLGFLIFLVVAYILLRVTAIRYFFHRFILFLPIFGKMSRDVNLANFCRTLGLTLKSGVQVVEAITITSESLSNLVYKKKLNQAAEEIRKGEALSPFFAKHKKLFPVMVTQMISVGETSGNLSESLLYLSDFYETEVTESTGNLSTVLEPLLMVVMGVVVGFVAISIITPIYEITSSVGR
ncbi:MAG: type II secretion system F family protein [bacterium]|nr:type II secretion system F family protein [bacterium]